MALIECPRCGDTLAPIELEAGLSLVCQECDEPDPEQKAKDEWEEPPETAHWTEPSGEVTGR